MELFKRRYKRRYVCASLQLVLILSPALVHSQEADSTTKTSIKSPSSDSEPHSPEATSRGELNPAMPRKPETFGMRYEYATRSMVSTGVAPPPGMENRGMPVSAQMQTHTMGVRYALSPAWALRANGGFVDNHLTFLKAGQEITSQVSGFSDTRVQGVATLFKTPSNWLELGLGVSLPTGAIDKTGSDGRILSTRVQPGSGTYDFNPSISYVFDTRHFVITSKAEAWVRNGHNARGYRLGDERNYSLVASYEIFPFLVPALNLLYKDKAPLGGSPGSRDSSEKASRVDASSTETPVIDSTDQQDPMGRSGTSWEASASVRSYLPLGSVRLNLETGMPFYQMSSRGPAMMRAAWYLGSGLQASF
jgi:hypothetical protein